MKRNRKRYVIQAKGQVTLPVEMRKKYDLKPGDEVVFEDTGEGIFINTKIIEVNRLLDELGVALKEKGVTLEELMKRGRTIRGQMIRELYALDDLDAHENSP